MTADRDVAFWRNAAVVGALHVAVVAAIVHWGGATRVTERANILWMDGGAAVPAASLSAVTQSVPIPPPPSAETEDAAGPDDADMPPNASSSASELPLPENTATPRPKPTSTPAATPKPSVKPTPKKALPAKASATPARPKRSAKPVNEAGSNPSPAATAAPEVMNAITAAAKAPSAPTVGISGTGAGGSTGRGVGAAGASQFGWYAHMLHDRFFSQWTQPTSVVRSGVKMSTLVKLRIEKDGRVSRFTILRPSGNVVVDESVAAVAKRVTQVEPLPSGLGDAGFYEVNINFELNSEQ